MSKRRLRNISDLTQQELQHKRDLDRKAQRALRERTKNRIQLLEQELENSRANQQENAGGTREEWSALREENERLKDTLQRIGNLVHSLHPSANVHASSALSLGNDIREESAIDDCITVDVGATSTGARNSNVLSSSRASAQPEEQSHLNNTVEYSGLPSPDDVGTTPRHIMIHAPASHIIVDGDDGEVQEPFGGAPQPANTAPSPVLSLPTDLHNNIVPFSRHSGDVYATPLRHLASQSSERDYYLDATQNTNYHELRQRSITTSLSPTGTRTSNPRGHRSSTREGVWSFLPRHTSPTCPLDQILLDFISSRKLMVDHGASIESVLGPKAPSVAAIVSPMPTQIVHPVSRVLGEVLLTFPNVSLPEKMSFMYLMHCTMRWQIAPSEENFERLPHWLRPTATQLTVPHAAWIDNIPWPRVRDVLIQKSDSYPFQDFSELYSQNVTVNWPYDSSDAVTNSHTDGFDDVALNPIFEKHIRKLSNWTVSHHFEINAPEMKQAIYSHD